jgi:hypothetical protein
MVLMFNSGRTALATAVWNLKVFFFSVAQISSSSLGLLIVEVSKSHTHIAGRTRLTEWSARRRDRYLHNTHSTQDTEPQSQRAYARDRTATEIGGLKVNRTITLTVSSYGCKIGLSPLGQNNFVGQFWRVLMIGRRFTDKFPNFEQCLYLKGRQRNRTRSVPSFKRKVREVPVSLGFIYTRLLDSTDVFVSLP